MEPDPDFPTVKFPNPEEGKSALTLAIKTANANNSTLILANDPDADRLAVAEKLPKYASSLLNLNLHHGLYFFNCCSGQWKIFNGNEIGALLGWWCFENFIAQHGRGVIDEIYMISSTVSSKILNSMAAIEGFHFLVRTI